VSALWVAFIARLVARANFIGFGAVKIVNHSVQVGPIRSYFAGA